MPCPINLMVCEEPPDSINLTVREEPAISIDMTPQTPEEEEE